MNKSFISPIKKERDPWMYFLTPSLPVCTFLCMPLHAVCLSDNVSYILHSSLNAFQFVLNINQNVTFTFSVYLLKTLFTILVFSVYCLGKGLSKQLQLRQQKPHLKTFKAPGLSSQPFLQQSCCIKRGLLPNKTGLCSFNHTL